MEHKETLTLEDQDGISEYTVTFGMYDTDQIQVYEILDSEG